MSKFYNGFTIGRLFFILNMIVQPNFYIAMIHLLLSTLAMMGLTFLIGFFVAAVIKLIAYAADSFDFYSLLLVSFFEFFLLTCACSSSRRKNSRV